MPITDKEKLELIERQLTETITEKVKDKLFKTYRNLGLVVGGIITFTGWGITQHIENVVVNDVRGTISGKIEMINQMMTQAEVLGKIANKLNEETEISIDKTKKDLQSFNKTRNELNTSLEQLEKANNQIFALTNDIATLQRTAQNLDDIELRDITPMKHGIETLSGQIATLSEQVNKINQLTANLSNSKVADKEKSTQIASALQGVIEETSQNQLIIENARRKTSVFLQFSVGTRNQATALVKRLTSDEFIIFDPERTDLANNKQEVRYFHAEDKDAAEKLANQTIAKLSELGYTDTNTDVKVVSFVPSQEKKPRPGVIELWLQIPKKPDDQSVETVALNN